MICLIGVPCLPAFRQEFKSLKLRLADRFAIINIISEVGKSHGIHKAFVQEFQPVQFL